MFVAHDEFQCFGVLAAELEDVPDLDATGDLHVRSACRARVAGEDLCGLDRAVPGEVATRREVDHVSTGPVGAGDPRSPGDDPRIEEVSDARGVAAPEHPWADVPLRQRGISSEVLVGERLDLCRSDLRGQPLHVDVAVPFDPDRQRFDGPVRVAQVHDHVLQRVGRVPVAVWVARLVVGVHEVDERGDRRRVRGVVHDRRWQSVERHRLGRGCADGLDVGGEVARRAADEGVLTDVERGEELLGCRAAHGSRHR